MPSAPISLSRSMRSHNWSWEMTAWIEHHPSCASGSTVGLRMPGSIRMASPSREIVLNRPVHGVQITKDESTGEFIYSAPIEVEDRVFPERCYYYPIPQSELNKNAALTPNPGW